MVIVLSVVSVIVVAVAIGAFVMFQGAVDRGRTAQSQTTTTAVTLPASTMETVNDAEGGFTIQYPKSWQRLNAPSRDLRLVANPPGSQDYVSVRVQRTDTPTTAQNLGNIRAVTDGIIGSNEGARVLQQNAVTINGLIGYYYLYTFTDEASGLTGAHSHYFLFQGRKMNSIVFQAMPTEGFRGLEPTFTQILNSFHSDPEPDAATTPPAAPTTTTP